MPAASRSGRSEQIYLRRPELLREKQNAVMTEALEALVAKVLIVDEFKTSVGAVPENMLDNQISQQIRKDFVDRQNFRKSLRQEGSATKNIARWSMTTWSCGS